MRKKLLSMLVLLMTAVSGAWAQEQSETIATTANIVEGTHFTISISEDSYADGDGMLADGGITVTSKNGETITKVVITCTCYTDLVNDGTTSVSSGTKEITNGGGTITVTGVNASTFTFTCSDDYPQFGQFVVYYTEAPAGPTEETVPLNHSANNTWAIAEMPGYDVELEVEYFNITVPTATTDDIYAGSTTPLINAGSTTEDGATMKYLVTATNEQPTSTDGFSADVPTAQAITAQGTYYVWYYLDLESGDDSDISALAVEVTVSAPAYAVTIDDASKDTDNWQATPAEQKAGQTVTLSYGGKKKIRNITIEKAPAEPAAPALLQVTVHESDWSPGSGDHIIYYASGETWAEAITNHPTENAGWSVSNNFVYYNAYQVYDGSDAVMADTPIENAYYEF